MNTHTAAEKMLETGQFYTAILLGREFGCSSKHGEIWLNGICKNDRYTTEIELVPVKKIKVVAIDGRRVTIDQLQNKALMFKRPSLLVGSNCHAL